MKANNIMKHILYFDFVIKGYLKDTGITRYMFVTLLIGLELQEKAERFCVNDIVLFRALNDRKMDNAAINALYEAGYIELLRDNQTYFVMGQMKHTSAYYGVSGKGMMLIDRFADKLRRKTNDSKAVSAGFARKVKRS